MLILTRRLGETLKIYNVDVTILEKGNQVRVGIDTNNVPFGKKFIFGDRMKKNQILVFRGRRKTLLMLKLFHFAQNIAKNANFAVFFVPII